MNSDHPNKLAVDHHDTLQRNPSRDLTIESELFHNSIEIGKRKTQSNTNQNTLQKDIERLRQPNIAFFTEDSIDERLQQLQGQCRIKKYEFLKFNLIKTILVMFLLILTFFGLFALKYSAWFRKKVFYDPCQPEEATHLFIIGSGNISAVVEIDQPGNYPIKFTYLKLQYCLDSPARQQPIPEAFIFQRNYKKYFGREHFKNGLTMKEVAAHREKYGLNEHLVEIPNYFSYLLDVMTGPFFLLQYFFCFIYFIQSYLSFSIALIGFSFVTTTINYIMLYVSFQKIKQMAQKKINVQVIREGNIILIDSSELVPGDIYIPEEQTQICADSIVVSGDIYVNEANLTGESHPIGKYELKNPHDIYKSTVWLYEGAKILEVREGCTFAIIINTGYTTTRGRIIRKILNREVQTPDIVRSSLFFILQLVSVAVIVYLATLPIQLSIDIEPLFILFKLVDFLASSAPPPLPIYFNLAYTMCLFRLRFKNISGTEPEKTVSGSQVKTFCFDKTGTLTKSDVQVRKIFKIVEQDNNSAKKNFSKNKIKMQEAENITMGEDGRIFKQITEQFTNPQHLLVWQLFATCHTTKIINQQLLGDEIDRQMFAHTKSIIQKSQDPSVRFIIRSKGMFNDEESQDSPVKMKKKNQNQNLLHVLRVNQFQSRFQSMSVLVTDMISKRSFIFIKGAPERLLQNCINIPEQHTKDPLSPHNQYTSMVKILSLNGFRTIAIGYREISSKKDCEQLLLADREVYEKNITLLGLVAFENKLKEDTQQTMVKLINANIQPKMITGDNIYIAVETARRSGILQPNEKVVFLEGKKQKNFHQFRNKNQNMMINLKKNKSKLLESVKSDEESQYYPEIEAPDQINGENTFNNFSRISNHENQQKREQGNKSTKFIGTIINSGESQEVIRRKSKLDKLSKIQNEQRNQNEGNIKKGDVNRIHPKPIDEPFVKDISDINMGSLDDQSEKNEIFDPLTFKQQIIIIDEKDYLENYTYAVDNSFLTFYEPYFSNRIKIFARIPPESKALVIKAYKNQNKLYLMKSQSKFRKLLRVEKLKIGMCGDGANDLLALREADLSIGIQETDASYGSSFTVQNISDVYEVIRESKCTHSNLFQLFQYYVGIPFVIVISSVLMLTDSTYFSTPQLIYINFGTMLLIPGAMAFSRPPHDEDKNCEYSKYTPDGNMMSLHSHLLIWGNIIIPFFGVLGSYMYLLKSGQYEPNPKPSITIDDGFNSQNHSATLIFLTSIFVCVCNGFIMYRSRPWKEPFYRNYLLTLVYVGNFATAVVFPFMLHRSDLRKSFEFVHISGKTMAICFAILLGSEILNLIYNLFLNSFRLDYKVLKMEETKEKEANSEQM